MRENHSLQHLKYRIIKDVYKWICKNELASMKAVIEILEDEEEAGSGTAMAHQTFCGSGEVVRRVPHMGGNE
jgi:hypothetical protein